MAEFDPGWLVLLQHTKKTALPPRVVAFSLQVLAPRFALLPGYLFLLGLNPSEFRYREGSNRVHVHAERGRNADPPDDFVAVRAQKDLPRSTARGSHGVNLSCEPYQGHSASI